MKAATARRLWGALLLVAVAGVLWVTLRPSALREDSSRTNLNLFEHHGRALDALRRDPGRPERDVIVYYLASNVLGNVLLFLPVGLGAAGVLASARPGVRLGTAAGFGVLLSASVELLQLAVPGRATDVDDVLFNGLGALVGASVLLVGERVLRKGRPGRRRRRGRTAARGRRRR